MRNLTFVEQQQIAGGFFADALFEVIAIYIGIAALGAFALGVGSVYAYQAFTAR